MRRLLLKFGLALALGLSLILGLLGLLIYCHVRIPPARAADHIVCLEGLPTCTFTNVLAVSFLSLARLGDIMSS